MRALRLACVLLAAAALPAAPRAAAQQAGDCVLVRSQGESEFIDQMRIVRVPYPVLNCPGGLVLRANFATLSQDDGTLTLTGRVFFRDSVSQLDADFARYDSRDRHLQAQGNVVLRDLATGSTIQGPWLDYFRESPTRPEPRIEVYSGRPRTTLVRAGADGAAPDTTVIDSDALTIFGSTRYNARGNVDLQRGDLRGLGQEMTYQEDLGVLRLQREASLITEEYSLTGDDLQAELTGDTIRLVTARGDARLDAEEMQVEAALVRIEFEAGEVHRLIASTLPAEEGGSVVQARALSPDFLLVADSIDALAPGQQIERLIAVGRAYSERLTPPVADAGGDTLAVDAPLSAAPSTDAAADVRDWMRGDTIRAYFSAAPAAEAGADTAVAAADMAAVPTRGERVLEQVVAVGTQETPASTLYRVPDERDPAAPAGLAYLVAHEIRVTLVGGEVRQVDADGEIRGLYLQPEGAAGRNPTRSARGGGS
jgi:hypothetical protein